MARRAAELGLAEGLDTDQAISKYQELMVRQLITTNMKILIRKKKEKKMQSNVGLTLLSSLDAPAPVAVGESAAELLRGGGHYRASSTVCGQS